MIPYRRTYWFEFVCKLMFTEEDMHVEASLFYIIRINKIVNEINFIICFGYSIRLCNSTEKMIWKNVGFFLKGKVRGWIKVWLKKAMNSLIWDSLYVIELCI